MPGSLPTRFGRQRLPRGADPGCRLSDSTRRVAGPQFCRGLVPYLLLLKPGGQERQHALRIAATVTVAPVLMK